MQSSMQSANMMIVSIEGLMGSGKSTLLSEIGKKSIAIQHKYPDLSDFFALLGNARIVEEPVEEFTSFGFDKTVNPLLLAYTKPKMNAFPAQLHIMRCVIDNYKAAVEKFEHTAGSKICLFERSPEACQIFIKTMKDSGFLSEFGSQMLLQEYFMEMARKHFPLPDVYIVLDADPQLCYERINNRARKGECNISLRYLNDLKHNYDTFFLQCNKPVYRIPVLPFTSTKEILNKLVEVLNQHVYG